MTSAPDLTACGTNPLLTVAPAEKNATSTPVKLPGTSSSTRCSRPPNFRDFPAARAEAGRRRSATGNFRSSRTSSTFLPTSPVAPTTATLTDFIGSFYVDRTPPTQGPEPLRSALRRRGSPGAWASRCNSRTEHTRTLLYITPQGSPPVPPAAEGGRGRRNPRSRRGARRRRPPPPPRRSHGAGRSGGTPDRGSDGSDRSFPRPRSRRSFRRCSFYRGLL